jgi:hypothetical protein
MKKRTKQVMEGRECFLKDLTEGATFRMRHTGGTVYTLHVKGKRYLVIKEGYNYLFDMQHNTPVRPLIKF